MQKPIKRMGMVLSLKKDAIDEYKKIHNPIPKDIKELLTNCNIRNYSIFLKEPENLLFSYFEYIGSDYEEDMKKMAQGSKEWWKICSPLQEPLPTRKEGEWWANMQSVFFQE